VNEAHVRDLQNKYDEDDSDPEKPFEWLAEYLSLLKQKAWQESERAIAASPAHRRSKS